MKGTIRNRIKDINKEKVAIFSVSSHMDGELQDEYETSKYEIPIQAGAALTSARVCEFNDYDDVEYSISDRNSTYCEMTAIYWAWKNIKTSYIGICHYRRKLKISDEEIDEWIADSGDVIAITPDRFHYSMKENYQMCHFKKDWEILEEAIRKLYPSDFERIEKIYNEKWFHRYNMGLFRKEIFDDYCEWIFPILEEVYNHRIEKVDKYQHRDVGFMAERLTSIYIELHKEEWKYKECGIVELKTKNNKKEINLDSQEAVMEEARNLFASRRIDDCYKMMYKIERPQKDLLLLKDFLIVYTLEKYFCGESMFERNIEFLNLETSIRYYNDFLFSLKNYIAENSDANIDKMIEILSDGKSSCWIMYAVQQSLGMNISDVCCPLAMELQERGYKDKSLELLDMAIKLDSTNQNTIFCLAYCFAVERKKEFALQFINCLDDKTDPTVIELIDYLNTM